MNNIETFERLESNVRMYCRDLPLVFDTAQGSRIRGEDGREYLDFFAGAGALNYGHNDPRMRDALIAYLSANGVTHALDLHTTTKRQFLEAIERDLFKPRGWDYKVQFTGPTGADAVEAALKLARKATGRTKVVSFYGAYHGMTAGALAVTGNRTRRGPGLSTDVVFVPYEDSPYGEFDSIGFLERLANDQGSGSELPAAVIVEVVQGEGGVVPAATLAQVDHRPRRAAYLRRNPGRLRPHRRLLRLRALRGGAGPDHLRQIDRRLRPADGDRVASCRAGCMATGRSHRHLPRQPVGVPDRPHRAQLLAR